MYSFNQLGIYTKTHKKKEQICTINLARISVSKKWIGALTVASVVKKRIHVRVGRACTLKC